MYQIYIRLFVREVLSDLVQNGIREDTQLYLGFDESNQYQFHSLAESNSLLVIDWESVDNVEIKKDICNVNFMNTESLKFNINSINRFIIPNEDVDLMLEPIQNQKENINAKGAKIMNFPIMV